MPVAWPQNRATARTASNPLPLRAPWSPRPAACRSALSQTAVHSLRSKHPNIEQPTGCRVLATSGLPQCAFAGSRALFAVETPQHGAANQQLVASPQSRDTRSAQRPTQQPCRAPWCLDQRPDAVRFRRLPCTACSRPRPAAALRSSACRSPWLPWPAACRRARFKGRSKFLSPRPASSLQFPALPHTVVAMTSGLPQCDFGDDLATNSHSPAACRSAAPTALPLRRGRLGRRPAAARYRRQPCSSLQSPLPTATLRFRDPAVAPWLPSQRPAAERFTQPCGAGAPHRQRSAEAALHTAHLSSRTTSDSTTGSPAATQSPWPCHSGSRPSGHAAVTQWPGHK